MVSDQGKHSSTWVDTPMAIEKIQPNLPHLLDAMVPEGNTILDVGCGGGYVHSWLRDNSKWPFSYQGIDASENEVARAEQLTGLRQTFSKARLEDLPPRSSWDIVWCSRLLIHLPNLEANLKTLHRASKRSTIVVLSVGEDVLTTGSDYAFRSVSRPTLEGMVNKLTDDWSLWNKRKFDIYSTLVMRHGRPS